MRLKANYWICLLATIFGLCVTIVGAYTRLADAGLGCPDWPGCYGQLTAPKAADELALALENFPGSEVETYKAQVEMLHRYIAGSLGIIVILLCISNLRQKERSWWLAISLMALIIFQATLGAWTVIYKLYPVVVMGHLMGGLTIVALLSCMTYRYKASFTQSIYIAQKKWLQKIGLIALGVLTCQLILGGWTSANYAALVCPDFPYCHGKLFPKMEMGAFDFFKVGLTDTPGSLLGLTGKISIHMGHRIGAIFTTITLGYFCWLLIRSQKLKNDGWLILVLLGAQATLGILTVTLSQPLELAVAHHAIGALLLIKMVLVLCKLYGHQRDATNYL